MSMTVVVTRNVPDRFRGFLASCMLEVAPGVYTNPRLSPSVRERVWQVLSGWFAFSEGASLVMVWNDGREPSGQGLLVLGEPPRRLLDYDGVILGHLAKEGELS